MTSKPPHFIDSIPSDIWATIASILEPRDILALQSTCRLCHQALSQRSVWITALQAMCRRNGVFYPSYTTASMSMRQIAHAALAPHAVTRAVRSATRDLGPETGSTPTIGTASTQSFVDEGDIYSGDTVTLLVPGGRYIVVWHHLSTLLSLWDLGPAGKIAEAPVSVAELDLHPDDLEYRAHCHPDDLYHIGQTLVAVSMDSSGRQVRVVTFVRSSKHPSTMVLRLFSIDPLAQMGWELVGTPLVFETASGDDFIAAAILIQGDVVVVCLRELVPAPSFIVNFVEGWYVQGPPTPGKAILKDHVLVCVDKALITVLDIQPLLVPQNQSPIHQDSRVQVPNVFAPEVQVVVPATTFVDDFRGSLVVPFVFHSGVARTPGHLAFHRLSSERRELCSYVLTFERKESALETFLNRQATHRFPMNQFLVPIGQHTSLLHPDRFIATVAKHIIIKARARTRALHPYGVYHLPPAVSSPVESAQSSSDDPFQGAEGQLVQFAKFRIEKAGVIEILGFCMWSGRLVYSTTLMERGVEKTTVHVVDLLEL